MAKKLTSTKARKILHDKEVHGQPLTDKQRRFFGAIAGGAKPYKAQIGTMLTAFPSNWGDRLSDVLEFPQKAITKLITGKYQEPSEALGIKTPLAAMAANMILDPANLITGGGSGAAKVTKAAKAVSKAEKVAAKSKDLSKYLTSELRDKGYSLLHTASGNENLLDLYNNKKRVGRLDLFPQPSVDVKGNKWGSIDINIDPSHRGKGLSKPLYSAALEEARRKGFSGLLSVDELLQSPEKSKAIRKYFPGAYSTDKNLLERTNKLIDEDNEFARELGQTDITPTAKQVYLIGTPKKKKHGGWLDKYDAPQAQNGIEGTMGGLTDIGFNYNGAWGGPSMQNGGNLIPPMAGANTSVSMAQLGDSIKPIPMQLAMGGSMPGAVGFMYARTQSPAPSNGPYAKKTKASAQNGQEMKYYQEGLDFTPKTISQNGSRTPIYVSDPNDPRLRAYQDSLSLYKGYRNYDLDKTKPIEFYDKNDVATLRAMYPNTELIERKPRPLSSYDQWVLTESGRKTNFKVGKTYSNKELALEQNKAEQYANRQGRGLMKNKGNLILDWKNQAVRSSTIAPIGMGYGDMKDIDNSNAGLVTIYKKPVQPVVLEQEPRFEKPIPIPRDTRDLGYTLPTPGQPRFPELYEYSPDTPTKFSFTSPTGGYNQQKTMYFPSKSALKSFTEGVRGATYQEGADYATATGNLQDGGDIPVDPMGYWNPENVGGPVIIPSNIITMEGVDQPLLGISDTGDVQYMEPGEDYEFDGDYVTEYPVAQGGKRVPIQTSDPADPRLHSYLDSLNLNKAYLAQRRINPEVGVRKFVEENLARILGSNKEKYIAREQGRKKTFKSLSKAKQAKFFKPGQLDDAWTSEAKFKKDVPEDAPLIDVYKGLTFSSPTETGLWTTPDLYNANIAPVDIYFGGKGNAAYNPVFMAPVQPIEYTGDPADYMKYRSSPTIHGSKQKFNPKLKLSQPPAKEKPEPKQEVVKKPEPVVEKKAPLTDYFQGTPVYAPTPYHGSGAGAFVGYRTPQGDTVFVKPEDYERMAVPKYGREFIESKKKMKNGGVSVNNADAQPLKKLDQLLNFTNYNKPTKGGWLDKYK